MATLSDLAGQADFRFGPIEISPSRRQVLGPSGTANLEPIVMQAMLILAERTNEVVTRETLFARCWGAAAVGDDSLNRAIAGVRKALDRVAPAAFIVETIPRTGYRLIERRDGKSPADSTTDGRLSRRVVIGGAIGTAVAGGILYLANSGRTDSRFEALMAQGDRNVRDGSAFEWPGIGATKSVKMVKLYEEAVRVDPTSARAWGLLGYYRSVDAQGLASAEIAGHLHSAMSAIDRALELDPSEPNARVGRYLSEAHMLDWTTRDRRLRDILKTDPGNVPAMIELMPLLQAAGLTRESWEWNERILTASPMAKQYLVAKAMKLWIMGRTRDSDNVIDRVRAIWPDYNFAFSVRLMLFGLTGRPQAALAMIQSTSDTMLNRTGPAWRNSLAAMQDGTPVKRDLARQTLLSEARGKPSAVNDIVMLLGALGMTEEAFEVTEGYLLWRGQLVTKDHRDGRQVDSANRRMTQWLFTPPLAAMRADARFQRLCDEFGLSAYWAARGVQPDYLRYR